MVRSIHKLLALLVSCGVVVGVGGTAFYALAQPEEEQPTSLLPRVFAQELKVIINNEQALEGQFKLVNSEDYPVNNLKYEVLLLSPAPAPKVDALVADNPIVYTRQQSSGVISLGARGTKEIAFTQLASPLPEGEYRLRLQLLTTAGRRLGWAETPVLLSGSEEFVVLEAVSVGVNSTDPITAQERTTWAPGEGVNVDPGQAVTLNLKTRTTGQTVIDAVPTLTTTRTLVHNQVATTQMLANIKVAPGRTGQTKTLQVVAPDEPGVYHLQVAFKDAASQTISSLAEFRYVVRGLSASVAHATISNVSANTATVDFSASGPADRETDSEGVLTIQVSDDAGTLGEAAQPVALSQGPIAGKAQIPLSRTLQGAPTLSVVLASSDGKILDSYEAVMPQLAAPDDATLATGPEKKNGISGSLLAMVLLSGLLVILLGIWMMRPPVRRPPPPTIIMLALGVVASIWLGAKAVEAAVGEYEYTHIITLRPGVSHHIQVFVNSPSGNQTYNSPVPYEVRLEWFSCGNEVKDGIVSVASGAGHQVFNNVTPVGTWLPHGSFTFNSETSGTSSSNSANTEATYYASLDIDALPRSDDRVTVWTRADIDEDSVFDHHFQGKLIRDVFTHIFVPLPPSPATTLAPTPRPSFNPFHCLPSTQTVGVGQSANFDTLGAVGSNFLWIAPQGNPQGASGDGVSTFSTVYDQPLTDIVTVRNGTLRDTCTVNVVASPQPSPAPSAAPSLNPSAAPSLSPSAAPSPSPAASPAPNNSPAPTFDLGGFRDDT